MSQLDNIVQVTISKSSATVDQASFDLICIVGPNATFSDRTKEYATSDLAALAADLTNGTADPEYAMASALAAQNPRVSRFKVGKTEVGDADLTASLNAINNFDPKWFGLLTVSQTKADQLLAAAWVETNKKVYIPSTAETDIVDTTDGADTTTLAAVIKSNAYTRTGVLYLTTAATEYPGSALLGKILPYTPGSYTAAFKTLAGIPVDNLSQSQVSNAIDKNASVYIEVGGRNVVQEGNVGDGGFIDTTILIDWIEARIQENVFGFIASQLKVPYTNSGIAGIEKEIDKVLKQAQDNGGISPTAFDADGNQIGGYSITVPALADVPAVDRASRTLNNVKFTAYEAGAIHKVRIEGTVVI